MQFHLINQEIQGIIEKSGGQEGIQPGLLEKQVDMRNHVPDREIVNLGQINEIEKIGEMPNPGAKSTEMGWKPGDWRNSEKMVWREESEPRWGPGQEVWESGLELLSLHSFFVYFFLASLSCC